MSPRNRRLKQGRRKQSSRRMKRDIQKLEKGERGDDVGHRRRDHLTTE
jgi:hypothetical protein